MLTSVGVARLLTMDLHADQIQGFFDIPVDNIYAAPVLLGDVWKQRYENLIVVSPMSAAWCARGRSPSASNPTLPSSTSAGRRPMSRVMNVIGEVTDRTCVIMDDMVDTAGTLVKAAQVLKEEGATRVVAYCTHPSFPAARSSASRSRTSTSSSSPIPFPSARTRARAPKSAVCPWRASLPRRSAHYTEESVSSLFIE